VTPRRGEMRLQNFSLEAKLRLLFTDGPFLQSVCRIRNYLRSPDPQLKFRIQSGKNLVLKLRQTVLLYLKGVSGEMKWGSSIYSIDR